MSDLVEYWRNRIELDLRPFADPGTDLLVDGASRLIQAEWTQRGKATAATFSVLKDQVRVTSAGREFSYSAFFASDLMADLLGLAKMTLNVAKDTLYVETRAKGVDEKGQVQEGSALDVIDRQLHDLKTTDATVVTMVTGEAGAGKTTALKQLVRDQAGKYLRGQSDFVFLYVDAQGRALARFNEALATELNDLRSQLTYHGVSTLVRLGLLVPVIDGFDELIGVGGYDDAFSSISLFIEELDGEGGIVASARSAYYEQEFLARANQSSSLGSQIWTLRSVSVSDWGDSERDKFIAKTVQANPGVDGVWLSNAVRKAFAGRNEPLSRKPLFVSRVTNLLLEGVEFHEEASLLEQLVENFVQRECGKLKSRTGREILTGMQVQSLLCDIAEEMWNQGRRELDRGTARELAEMTLIESDLPQLDRQIVVERVSAFAFLEPGEAQGSVAFEHEVFFAYFFAKRLAHRLVEAGPSLVILLGRSVLPEEVPELAVTNLGGELGDDQAVNAIVGKLCGAAEAKSLRREQVRENAGALLTQVFRSRFLQGKTVSSVAVRDVVFPGGSLANISFRLCTFHQVEFKRTNICSAKFAQSTFSNVVLSSVLVDENTFLDVGTYEGIGYVHGLRFVTEDGAVSEHFDPRDVQVTLSRLGLVSERGKEALPPRAVDPEVMALIERFARAYLKRNPVCEDDSFLGAIFEHRYWVDVRRALKDAGVVREEVRDAHGPRRTFLRRQVAHEQIMMGAQEGVPVEPSVRKFWDLIQAKFAA